MDHIKRLYRFSEGYRKNMLLVPVWVFVQVGMEVWIPYLMGDMVDKGIYGANTEVIKNRGLLMLLAAVIMMTAGVMISRHLSKWASGVGRNLRDNLFISAQRLSFADSDQFGVSSIITRMSTDVSYVKNALMMFNTFIRCPLMVIMTITVTATVYQGFAKIFIISAIALFVASMTIARFALRHYRKMFVNYDKMNDMLEENITAQKTVKAFARSDYETSRFSRIIGVLRQETRMAETLSVMNEPVLGLVMDITLLAVILISGRQIIGGVMQAGDFFCLVSYTDQILFRISLIAGATVPLMNAQVSLDRIVEVMDTEPAIKSGQRPSAPPADGSVSFRDVCMSYFEGKNVLNNIDIEIKPGEFVGIIGSSGSGKTSMINLIPRFYDCNAGTVSVGGEDVKDYDLDDLRGAIGLVPQASLLFTGTIADNLRWGNEDATVEEIVDACVAAGANDFIMGFPDGYDTRVSQGGSTVSGGQKQRLCIARALISKPGILILDDSLSAVDNTTEGHIIETLRKMKGTTTIILVSQRFTSVKDADRIIVLDEGRIDAAGTHKELLASSKVYNEIYDTQRRTMA